MPLPRVLRLGWWLLLAGLAVVLLAWAEERFIRPAHGAARGLLGLR